MLELNEYYYYANLALYYCDDCGGEFIVSCEKTINTGLQAPFCPYCRSSQTQMQIFYHGSGSRTVSFREPFSY